MLHPGVSHQSVEKGKSNSLCKAVSSFVVANRIVIIRSELLFCNLLNHFRPSKKKLEM